MRAQEWKGLITNASPYVLPPGAATEQVNLLANTPGQLVSRGGMNKLSFAEASAEIVDVYPHTHGGATKLIALKPDGSVVVLTSPAIAAAPTSPTLPALSPASGQVESTYIGQFYESGGEAPL